MVKLSVETSYEEYRTCSCCRRQDPAVPTGEGVLFFCASLLCFRQGCSFWPSPLSLPPAPHPQIHAGGGCGGGGGGGRGRFAKRNQTRFLPLAAAIGPVGGKSPTQMAEEEQSLERGGGPKEISSWLYSWYFLLLLSIYLGLLGKEN